MYGFCAGCRAVNRIYYKEKCRRKSYRKCGDKGTQLDFGCRKQSGDDKKRNYYLLVVKSSKKIDLNDLKNKINSRRLSFASEIDLEKYLKLKKGSVTPLGVLNDVERKVKIIIDEDILKEEIVGVHPNDNDATVFMKTKDLIRLIELNGNLVEYAKVGDEY